MTAPDERRVFAASQAPVSLGPAPVSPGLAAAMAGGDAPRVTSVYCDRTGRVRTAQAASAASAEAVIRRSANMRRVALANLPPSRDHGLNLERVDRFLASRGLATPPAVLLTRPEVAAFRDFVVRRGWSSPILDRLASPGQRMVGGGYIGELGIVIALRDEAMERLNGPAFTEALLVHEKAHAYAVARNIIVYRTEDGHTGYLPCRSGFVCVDLRLLTGQGQGSFLEEGFAEFLAGEYVRSELGMPNGIWRRGERPWRSAGLDSVPARYLWRGSVNGAPGVSHSPVVLPATGLELLIRHQPELWPALVSARTSVSGLRDVARIVDSVSPGLYVRLRRLEYTETDFTAGLADIRSAMPRSLGPGITTMGDGEPGLQRWARSQLARLPWAGQHPTTRAERGLAESGRRTAPSRHHAELGARDRR